MDGRRPHPRRGARSPVALIVGTASAAMAVVGTLLTSAASADAFSRVGAYGEPGVVVAGASILLCASLVLTAGIGTLIAVRLPGHPLGGLLVAQAILLSIGSLSQGYTLAAYQAAEVLPGGELAAWANNVVWGPAIAMLAVALLVFPSGRPVSRRWGRSFALVLAISVGIMVVGLFAPGPLPLTLGVENPFGIASLGAIPREALNFGVLLVVLLTAFAAVSLVVRYRRSSVIERLQLKWVAAATLLVAVVFASLGMLRPWDEVSDLLFWASMTTLPIAIGIAILRYRLYAIDLIIRRTLLYGALTGVLGTGYALAVVMLQALLDPITGGETLGIAVATLLAAGAFRPVRTRIQEVIDRRFYRVRYDVERATADLAARLGREVDLDVIEADLVGAVVEAVHPVRASVWSRGSAAAEPRR